MRALLIVAAVLAAAFVFVLTSLPDRRVELPPPSWQTAPTAVGVFHIHTNRSDGSGSPDEVAAAAARAGLQFIILTDHGDGTREAERPQYRSGVLCIDSVEISTSTGHYIAIGLPKTPYPLGGEARGVIEDVARLGGFGVVAHPDSHKPSLQWHEWTAPFPAMEWLNADTEWRDETRRRLAHAILDYPFRPVETLGSLLDRPDQTLARWDGLTTRRRIVALAGADAHARVGWRDEGDSPAIDADGPPPRRGRFVRIPSYETSFRTFANRVEIAQPFTGDAMADARQLLAALKAGHVYTGIDAIATPVALEFVATSPHDRQHTAGQGDLFRAEGPVMFRARVNTRATSGALRQSSGRPERESRDGGVIVLRKGGEILTQHPLPALEFESTAGSGAYRVEVYLSQSPGDPPVPWIVSNPIYVYPASWETSETAQAPAATDSWGIQGPWNIEKDAASTAQVMTVDPSTGSVEFNFQLAAGERRGQYAALALSVGHALRGHSRISVRARASQPMRISVQARQPTPGVRWQRSIYLDEQPREVLIPFAEMRPVDPTSTLPFVPDQIDTILFVVDTANTRPGSRGSFVLSDVRVEH